MTMVQFGTLFREVEEHEIRSIVVDGQEGLPDGTFAFVELYCREPGCDCRRVMINVLDLERKRHIATINHGFDPPKAHWRDEGQTFLDPLNTQGRWSAGFLEFFLEMIARDADYRIRLERHYEMWKRVVDDPRDPRQKLLPPKTDDDFALVTTVRREAPKVGANEPCPCGSGKKYKFCCRG
jgi:preprotein translocase subunit SecA